jgi:hypothetical protein
MVLMLVVEVKGILASNASIKAAMHVLFAVRQRFTVHLRRSIFLISKIPVGVFNWQK